MEKNKEYDITVVGGGAVDVERFELVDGSYVQGERHAGGKGFNQAISAARAGAYTAIIGPVGNDENGKFLIENAKKNGIDADKESYPYYFEKVLELLRPGGTMLVDNVLWYGKVMMEEEDKKDPSTKILKEFNEMVTKDKRVESIILPIRDGITLIRKK